MKNLALIIKNILSKLLTEYAILLTFNTYTKSQWVKTSTGNERKTNAYADVYTLEHSGKKPLGIMTYSGKPLFVPTPPEV